jgi:hypothetical protein
MSHQPNDNNNHADADETYLRIDEAKQNPETQQWEIRETNESDVLIELHEFTTESEAIAFSDGYELAGEHNLEEYDRLVRQYNRLAAQSGLIERYLNIAEEIGHDAETIIATIRKITA